MFDDPNQKSRVKRKSEMMDSDFHTRYGFAWIYGAKKTLVTGVLKTVGEQIAESTKVIILLIQNGFVDMYTKLLYQKKLQISKEILELKDYLLGMFS